MVAITGHEAPSFDSSVERLGQAGVLRGRLLMLNTCHGSLKPEWNAHIIRDFGAVGIRSFTVEISPTALKDVMFNYYELLQRPELQGMPMEQVWKQAVERAIRNTDQEGLRREIEKLLDTVTQISEVMFAGGQRAPKRG